MRITRKFDDIFERHRDRLPLEYVRALAYWESGMNPNDTEGGAHGILQIVPVLLRDFNRNHNTKIKRSELLDPDKNTRIACWLLNRIAVFYAPLGRTAPNFREDWNNPHFVELLTAGWNAGFSRYGLIAVAKRLIAQGITNITVDDIQREARVEGSERYLALEKRLRWWKKVGAEYVREVRASEQLANLPPPPTDCEVDPAQFDVREQQKALAVTGHDPGPLDGIMGRQTRAALRAFQFQAWISADGIWGPMTGRMMLGRLRELGLADVTSFDSAEVD